MKKLVICFALSLFLLSGCKPKEVPVTGSDVVPDNTKSIVEEIGKITETIPEYNGVVVINAAILRHNSIDNGATVKDLCDSVSLLKPHVAEQINKEKALSDETVKDIQEILTDMDKIDQNLKCSTVSTSVEEPSYP